MERIYKFDKTDFDQNGFKLSDGKFFLDIIKEWEKDFHLNNEPFYANYLFAGNSTMLLIKSCIGTNPYYTYGMELIDGEVNFEVNQQIDRYSEKSIIYAIGSAFDGDEPLFLVIDAELGNGIVVLKHIPDNGTVNDKQPLPVDNEKVIA